MTQLNLFQESTPIVALLRAHLVAHLAVIRTELPKLKTLGTLTDEQLRQLEEDLVGAVRGAIACEANLRRGLPRTTACICPSCREVTLPVTVGGELYDHCGRWWMPSARAGYRPLPDDFWTTHLPGDTYQGPIAADWVEEEIA